MRFPPERRYTKFFLRLLPLAVVFACAPQLSWALLNGMADGFSPFIGQATVQGEIRVRPGIYYITKGQTRNKFNMTQDCYALDLMARLQINRVSVRIHYDKRDFSGGNGSGEALLNYSGYRVGGDFDLVQWNRSRLGINLDYEVFEPHFYLRRFKRYSPNHDLIQDLEELRVIRRRYGDRPLTLGFHFTHNPLWNLYGITPIMSAAGRWSVAGSRFSEWEISAGAKAPETVIGSWALQVGYAATNLGFRNHRNKTGGVPREQQTDRFDTSFAGFFGELTYFY